MSPPDVQSGPPGITRPARPRTQRPPTGTLTARNPTARRRLTPAFTPADLPERFRCRIIVDQVSGCWVGQCNIDRDGYARLAGEGLHRLVWAELVGPVPPGLVLDHVQALGCRFNACCNPAHLEPVTHRVNVLRGTSFAARNAAKDKCDHGHEFDLFNTYWRPNGNRDCRACIRARVARYQARLRASACQLAA